jgi:diaminopimelate decarboxylase
MHENFWIHTNPFFEFHPLSEFNQILIDYNSPCFIYSKKVIAHQYNLLKNNLPENFEIFYAEKSNPNLEILKLISSFGTGCDTASIGEVKNAIDAGFDRKKIMMTGPGKTEDEINFAIKNKLLSINIESLQELEAVNKCALENNIIQDILLRINPTFAAGEKSRIIGGMGPSKFGIDAEQIPLFMMKLKNFRNVRLKGIHIFNSSQILNWKKIFKNSKNVIAMVKDIEDEFQTELEIIDLGGGFGIPYSEDEEKLDVELLGIELRKFVIKRKNYLESKRLIFEPGRFLSGPAGIYLTKVLYTKISLGKNFAITDGGIHHLVRPALIKQKHPIINISALLENRFEKEFYTVAGPLCTSLDQFDDLAYLNHVKQGDILGILNAGAYGYTESMPYFLSHRKAKEIFID